MANRKKNDIEELQRIRSGLDEINGVHQGNIKLQLDASIVALKNYILVKQVKLEKEIGKLFEMTNDNKGSQVKCITDIRIIKPQICKKCNNRLTAKDISILGDYLTVHLDSGAKMTKRERIALRRLCALKPCDTPKLVPITKQK